MPASQGGYEVRIPIGDGSQLIPERVATASAETVHASKTGDAPTSSPAYLSGLARVQALFRRDSYELALSEVVTLLKDYPNDTRLMSMQGTLLWKLGDKARAQAVWEEVVRRDPDNGVVQQMLEGVQ
jgi:predicted Zn-dependent protease